jgi:hypothetical protein
MPTMRAFYEPERMVAFVWCIAEERRGAARLDSAPPIRGVV